MNENFGVNKPITVARQELIDEIWKIINDYNFPAFVMEAILKDMYYEVREFARRQYESDKVSYEQALSKQQEENFFKEEVIENEQ